MKSFVQYMILYLVRNMGLILFDPIFFLILIYSIVMYKRQEDKLQGIQSFNAIVPIVVTDMAIGIMIGLCTSGVLNYFHITLKVNMNILLLIPIAIVLMLQSPKWGCFAYVVPVAYIIEGIGQLLHINLPNLDYEMLIYLVGILHIIEGILVILNGHQNATPIPIYSHNKLTFIYVMHHIWIVPLIFVMNTNISTALPLYALLAYGDEASVHTPKEQATLTGLLILLFGSLTFLLAMCIERNLLQVSGGILLMPVLHELIFVTEVFMNERGNKK